MGERKRKPQPDVSVENHGTLFLFTLHTEHAVDWWRENVQTASADSEPEHGKLPAYMHVEHGYARDLAQAMLAAGLLVE